MRVFFDTNVLASAFATRGFCAEVFDLALERHEVVVGQPVLVELERVLADRFGVDSGRVGRVLRFLRGFPVVSVPPLDGTAVLPDLTDPDDVPVLASALAARANVLVTGDRALQVEAAGVQALSPRQYWELLRAEETGQADRVHEPVSPYGR